jgi:predicted RND superfamily exporter protein
MWIKISSFILRKKYYILAILLALTLFFAYHARHVEMSYEYTSLLPKEDIAFTDYTNFVKVFGEEGNLIIIGIQDSIFFNLDRFQKWRNLCNELKSVEGVENLLSISNSYNLLRDTVQKSFVIKPIFQEKLNNQAELDSLSEVFYNLPFYRNFIYNNSTHTYGLVITVNKDKMHTREREAMVKSINRIANQFEKDNKVKLHYSGLPYIRVMTSFKIKKEIFLFSFLALVICIIFLFIFFRSFKAVVIPVSIVLIQVVWAMGMMSLFGFKITILTGMMPAIIIIIGIENSIYMLNKYNFEFSQYGNKIKALQRVIIRIGTATFMTNLTAAAGFGTSIMTKSDMLIQFGIITSINIICLFLLSLVLIPIIYSFVDPPKPKHLRYLEGRSMTRIIDRLILITKRNRRAVYSVTIGLVILGFVGAAFIKTSGYMVDDLPKSDPIYKDLKFFEQNFHGLMPLEIMVDTKKPNGVIQISTFRKMDQLEKKLAEYPELSPPLSLLNLLKFAKQAYYNGNPSYYTIPSNMEKNFILAYASKGKGHEDLLHSFWDSTKQVTRISFRVKDVGTKKMDVLYTKIKNDIDSIFSPEDYHVVASGSSITTFKGTQYLFQNLFTSVGLAIFLISMFMAMMFSSPKMVVISLVPNLIPLVLTGAVMGIVGIPIKASTILVFSVAFGISVDSTIQFLTKYRFELKVTGWDIRRSVILALRETGIGMIYTAAVLFFGFGIFSLSTFGGTQAMGVLVSFTLLVAITSNLILLPSLLTGLVKFTEKESFETPLIPLEDENDEIKKLDEMNSGEDNHISSDHV